MTGERGDGVEEVLRVNAELAAHAYARKLAELGGPKLGEGAIELLAATMKCYLAASLAELAFADKSAAPSHDDLDA